MEWTTTATKRDNDDVEDKRCETATINITTTATKTTSGAAASDNN